MSAQPVENPDVTLQAMLAGAFRVGASDIHFRVGQSPRYRVAGSLRHFDIPPISHEQMNNIVLGLLRQTGIKELPSNELEFSFEQKDVGRFRASLFREAGRLAVTLRTIPAEIPNLNALRLPAVLRRVTEIHRGLVLVTGATGMGKSTTAAAMLSLIGQSRPVHIITIEDPIEFIMPQYAGTVTQREVGRDTPTFYDGLRSALRQDPDVLFIGELRDRETVSLALQAAESGHLVLATFHTSNAVTTINRLAGIFPSEEQIPVRLRLATVLAMAIGLKLLPRAEKVGRVVACEVMVPTPSIVEAIRDPNKTSAIDKHIANGRFDHGMQSFDSHLAELLQAELISLETAKAAATHTADFVRGLQFTR